MRADVVEVAPIVPRTCCYRMRNLALLMLTLGLCAAVPLSSGGTIVNWVPQVLVVYATALLPVEITREERTMAPPASSTMNSVLECIMHVPM